MRLLLTAAVIALTVTACGSDDPDSIPAPTVTAAPSTTAAGLVGLPPPPTEAQRRAFIVALAAIDPALADRTEAQIVDDGRNICLDAAGGKTPDQLASNAATRFSVPAAQATQIVAAARATLCRT